MRWPPLGGMVWWPPLGGMVSRPLLLGRMMGWLPGMRRRQYRRGEHVRTERRVAYECPYRGFSLPSKKSPETDAGLRSAAHRGLVRSSAITCNVWWHSVSLRRRRSRTGCCACTVTPWGARATGHFDRFHPGSSETRIAGSSGSASRQASARRGTEPPAASPDLLRERDDAPSFPPFSPFGCLAVAAGLHTAQPFLVGRADPWPVTAPGAAVPVGGEEALGHRARWRSFVLPSLRHRQPTAAPCVRDRNFMIAPVAVDVIIS